MYEDSLKTAAYGFIIQRKAKNAMKPEIKAGALQGLNEVKNSCRAIDAEKV